MLPLSGFLSQCRIKKHRLFEKAGTLGSAKPQFPKLLQVDSKALPPQWHLLASFPSGTGRAQLGRDFGQAGLLSEASAVGELKLSCCWLKRSAGHWSHEVPEGGKELRPEGWHVLDCCTGSSVVILPLAANRDECRNNIDKYPRYHTNELPALSDLLWHLTASSLPSFLSPCSVLCQGLCG